MDKPEIIDVLREVDRRLSSACDVLVVGGAAMILHFGASRTTRDVDMVVLRGDVAELRRAIRGVAQERNLPDDWMSDAAKGFADILPPDFQRRLVLLGLPLERLRLYVPGRPEQVAMKVAALREQDLEDLELLLPQMTQADREDLVSIMYHVGTIRPDWAQKIHYFLLEQGWEIH